MYGAQDVIRILPSVLDREGFDARGGRHRAEAREEDDPGIRSSGSPTSSMDALAEVLDCEAALEACHPFTRAITRDALLRPAHEMEQMYGPEWSEGVKGHLVKIAARMNAPNLNWRS